MSKIKISELADELKIDKKELLAKAQEFGISAKATTKTLSDVEEKQLRAFYSPKVENKSQEVIETSESRAIVVNSMEKVSEQKKSKFSFLSKLKGGKKKTDTLRKMPNEKPPKPKKFSSKNADILIVGGIGFLLLSNIVLLGLVGSGFQPTHKIIHEQLTASQKALGSGLDLQAKSYLDGFVQTYFSFPEDEKDQEQTVKE